MKRIGKLTAPLLLGMSEVNLTISTILASLIAGAPTYLFYGMRLIQFPLGIFGVALAMAILPTLSAQATRGAMEDLRATLGFGLRMIVFIMFPATSESTSWRTPIVHLFFKHRTFTAHDTAETAMAVLCYAVGLGRSGGVRIIVAAFCYLVEYEQHPPLRRQSPVAANIVFCSLMSPPGASGLALLRRSQEWSTAAFSFVALNHVGGVEWHRWAGWPWRVMVADPACTGLWVAGAQVWTHEGERAAKSVMLAVISGQRQRISGCTPHFAEELGSGLGIVRNNCWRMAGREESA